MLVAVVTGWFLQLTGSYFAIFIALASAYLLALAIVHWLKPDLRPAELGGLEAKG
jgi:ACS family hexuronate transporter-like MFS transporter